jgi:hypothetical protein
MAISSVLPTDGSIIDPDTSVSFIIDNTWTTMRIEIDTEEGVAYAYDSALGGQQTGYVVVVTDNGDGTDTFLISADSGWDKTPQAIDVIENETGSEATTTISWTLSGVVTYPQTSDPYYTELGGSFKVTEDNAGVVVNVSHLDFVKGAVDGIQVTDLGGGKIRLTARATTNDPNAIHDNVAAEISAIAEKTNPADEDLALLEDSSDSYAKKKVQKQNMGGARIPAKLSNDYSAVFLYNFDGVLTDEITGTFPLTNTVGTQLFTSCIVPEAQALYLTAVDGVNSPLATSTVAQQCLGEVTVQCVFYPGKAIPESGLGTSGLVYFHDDIGSNNMWGLQFPANGANYMNPGFFYDDYLGSTVLATDLFVVVPDGIPTHMVGRMTSEGGGLYTVDLIVNNKLIKRLTGQNASWDPGTDNCQMRVGKYGSSSGCCRMGIESIKVSNVALTDEQIEIEYRKVMGYPAL